MFRYVLTVVAVIGVAACHRGSSMVASTNHTLAHAGVVAGGSMDDATSLLLSPEDVLTLDQAQANPGPAITGAIQPERRADLRAEVSAVVLQVLKDNGDAVHRGDLLVRLDDTAIRDSFNSAEASQRAAQQTYDQAKRQYERMAKLRDAGMVSTQSVEDAEIRRDGAQSDLEAAKARVVLARQQLDRTEARAPFDGIISDRKVSAGDTAQIGKELVKVIDPRSMRFEGMVSADHVGEVKAGQPVRFRIHGYADREFSGRVTRVNPATNATTRQVEVLVSIADNTSQFILAGLYAEGYVDTGVETHLMLPASVVVKEGDHLYAWRVQNHLLQKIALSVGRRDERSGEYELLGGLGQGDVLLRHPDNKLVDGEKIEMTQPAPSTAS
ncbi:MAG TPA: efflux RND transporter periplasmic adaptor subunit [Steroidobacteraceae bacterium]|nr:efflux RND transporter periplasmic adaptor subunit [Steroidobacteraceae bacterium]